MTARPPRTIADDWRWIHKKLAPFISLQVICTAYLLGASVLGLADPLVIRWIIDRGLRQTQWTPILLALALLLGLFAIRSVLLFIGNMMSASILLRWTFNIRLDLFDKLQSLDAHFYSSHPVGDLVLRMEQDVDLIGAVSVDLFPSLIRISLTTIILLAVMIYMDWRLTCLVVPFVPLFVLLRSHFRSALERASDIARRSIGERCNLLNEWLAGVLQIQLLDAGMGFKRRYGRGSVEAIRTMLGQRRVEMSYTVTTQAILALVTASVLAAGSLEVLRGMLTIGGYVAFYSYLIRLFDPLSAAIETYARVKRANGSIRHIRELEAACPLVSEIANPEGLVFPIPHEIECIKMQFAYPQQTDTLHSVDLRIKRGEKAALIGRSGSGKSTISRLLIRMYDPTAGKVLLDGRDISRLSIEDIRSCISLVPQSPILFSGSIRENVLLGKPTATMEELIELSHLTCFDSVVAKFPDQWEHRLGPGGSGLSDGEKQRLALLRALLQQKPILIFDEATSALDPAIEAELLTRMEAYSRDKIVLMITHRLSAACWSNKIIVLHNGGVAYECSPNDLAQYGTRIQEHLWGTLPAKEQSAAILQEL
jgi:ABC-type multidrug transport system fused ATPase/permease subunit